MASYKDMINSINPIEYSKYACISSYEKLMIYAAYQLLQMKIPLTFSYICITTFKMFPEIFCCDEEFKEFPSVDRLNRTMMHLKYNGGKALLIGSQKEGYTITQLGLVNAINVASIIDNVTVVEHLEAPIVDSHKRGFMSDYNKLVESDGYKKYLDCDEIDINYVWDYFDAIPYTRIKHIFSVMQDIQKCAEENGNDKCVEYIKEVMKMIKGQ